MAERRTWSLAVVASVLVAGPALSSDGLVADVPFELHQRNLIVAKGSIGTLNGLNLLIDTGTIPSVVDAKTARRLHLQTEPSTLVGFGQQLAVHSAVVDDIASVPWRQDPCRSL